jgi:hypothetical protein
METIPRVFISYAWEPYTKIWVQQFATQLRCDGIDARIEQWDVALGDLLTEYMERSIRENDFVLIVCTPLYKIKADSRKGGVGYEGNIITGEIYAKANHRKFIPVLWKGAWPDAAPSFLISKYYCDLRGGQFVDDNYRILVNTLKGITPSYPPIGIPGRRNGDIGPKRSTASGYRIVGWMKGQTVKARLAMVSVLLIGLFVTSLATYYAVSRAPKRSETEYPTPSNNSNGPEPSLVPTTNDAGRKVQSTPSIPNDNGKSQSKRSNQAAPLKGDEGVMAKGPSVGFVLYARVYDGQTPIRGAKVSIVGTPELGTVETDSNGGFKFEGLHKGLDELVQVRVEYKGVTEEFSVTIGQPIGSFHLRRTK